MQTYPAVVERCQQTSLYVGHVPSFPGAHSQGETLDERNANFREAIGLIFEEGAPVEPDHEQEPPDPTGGADGAHRTKLDLRDLHGSDLLDPDYDHKPLRTH